MIRVDKNDHSIIHDTTVYRELNLGNNFSVSTDFSSNSIYDYILIADSSNYMDTISDLSYDLKGSNCNARIIDLEYRFNGVISSDGNIVIQ
jgi:hypothetical protein